MSQIEVRLRRDVTDTPELQLLFHRLNNQLGIILAHAELLESKVPDAPSRARASQVVASALEAMGTVKDLRQDPSRHPTSRNNCAFRTVSRSQFRDRHRQTID